MARYLGRYLVSEELLHVFDLYLRKFLNPFEGLYCNVVFLYCNSCYAIYCIIYIVAYQYIPGIFVLIINFPPGKQLLVGSPESS